MEMAGRHIGKPAFLCRRSRQRPGPIGKQARPLSTFSLVPSLTSPKASTMMASRKLSRTMNTSSM